MRTVFRACLLLPLFLGIAAWIAPCQADPIRIGVLSDMSGPYADFAGMGAVAAAELAIEDFRKAHGAAQIELLQADHQNKPDIAVAIARKWYDREGVSAIVELVHSASALAVATAAIPRLNRGERPVIDYAGIVLVGLGAAGLTVAATLVRNLVGQTLVTWWEDLMNRIPLVRTLYSGLKGFTESLMKSKASFRQVVLIEFPRRDAWTVAFVTATNVLGAMRVLGIWQQNSIR